MDAHVFLNSLRNGTSIHLSQAAPEALLSPSHPRWALGLQQHPAGKLQDNYPQFAKKTDQSRWPV
jgi:hypothetical protein